jgi:tetratricopeptide (TPR) repeat protein/DNA-binding CsgD family transcriptional regulator
MVTAGADHISQPDQFNWLRRLMADHPNILSALDYLIESEDVQGAYRLGSRIWSAWWRWGYLSQGRQWLNKILTLPDTNVDNTVRARILEGVAYLAMHQNDYRVAETYFEESLKIWRENGISKNLGTAISGLAGTYRTLGNYERALQLNYESLELFRLLNDDVNVADSLCNIAWQLMERGDYEQVQAMLEESLALHSRANYLSGIARAKIYLGDYLWRKNNPQQAIQYLEESIAMLREVNHRIRLPSVLYRLGLIYLCQGQLALAEKYLEESVETAEEMHKPLDLTYAYSNLGLLRLAQKDLAGAEVLFRKALNLRPEVGQLEGILWAMEGLAVLDLQQVRYAEAQDLIDEAHLLRQAICAPVLPHTIKFILPVLVNHNKITRHQVDHLKASYRLAAEKVAVETIPPASSLLVSQPLSFGLDAAVALSKRENEVLKLIAEGHRTSQIAKILVISPGTVNNHLNSIYSKLGVNSRTAAVRYALDHSLL